MTTDIIKRFFMMLGLCLLQALVLNRIHLFGVATPFLYLWIPIHFLRNTPRWSALMWCFCTGLIIDVLSNTPGVAAGAFTVVGLLQPYLLPAFISRDEKEDLEPSMKNLGWAKFMFYSFLLTIIFCICFYTLETFSFFNIVEWALANGGSTALTLFLIIALEKIRD